MKKHLDLLDLSARQLGLKPGGGANPTYVIAYFTLGAAMIAMVLYNVVVRDEPFDRNYVFGVFGLVLIAVGLMARSRNRPPASS
ncbi:MAG: hypothetical protein JF625_24885 [Inquilinus limosus]|uniref:Uncharacterized protein n=1 Tax=Inquilinus limosus TaxID=171674 RepID=A0A952KFK1_9PROT|nr:hypothetical protein [Inquilinus limosus]